MGGLEPVQSVPLVHMQVGEVGANAQNAQQALSHQRVLPLVHLVQQEPIL